MHRKEQQVIGRCQSQQLCPEDWIPGQLEWQVRLRVLRSPGFLLALGPVRQIDDREMI
jgi:hypothetical protein